MARDYGILTQIMMVNSFGVVGVLLQSMKATK